MARLPERDYTYFTTVRGLCRTCRQDRPARVFFRQGQVFQECLCPTCVNEPALIAGDADWYLANAVRGFPDHSPLPCARPARHGCPHDCGPCSWHASSCQLPVISITNACELRCPICFTYNRSDRLYSMTPGELRERLDGVVRASGRVDLVNLTGGEPTLHPQLLELLSLCRRPEIGRITLNSNGLRLAEDDELCARLAELEVQLVLSLNTLDPRVSLALHGRDLVEVKLRALERLTRAGVRVALLLVLVRGLNEEAAGQLLDLMGASSNILALTIQTMTYTGQGGGSFRPRSPIPVDEAARIVCAGSGGALTFSDFLPRPSSHPLCYLSCFMLRSGGAFLPLARLAARETILGLLGDSYLPRLEADHERFLREAIDGLFARGEREHLARLRQVVESLYPPGLALDAFERQRRAQAVARVVTIHAHMDEDSFDATRAMLCPDLVPAQAGQLIPACTYNLFYRRQDERFYATE